ncbi:aspartate/glutamate racemase family protein [Parvibaculum sp.]|mgnify:CR=1 FL=1|uniref:aspartate/glutamate racemase family protein n=1 Tax=Parvibaculum sp. TaxID=2024848 RepID=UPI000C8EFD7B|nr:aspartate/glutamate racemase family protein [Parvibaculum sp.]MAB13586.1 aspartate racemase [Parvibaculum sp.]
MKLIGLIGGMSWESSAQYYRIINREVQARLGGAHSARSVMLSVDFAEIERWQHDAEWERLGEAMSDAGQRLERAGAEFLVLCTNTMHRVADTLEGAVDIPLLHIVDPTAERLAELGITRVGLLGTAFTMEQEFFKERLVQGRNLDVMIPGDADRDLVHNIIYRELVTGEVRPESQTAMRAVMSRLVGRGAQAIILGCTEIMLLVSQEDCSVPLLDTTTLHAQAAVDLALEGTKEPA